MQALHPAALAGVRQHSRYRQDALGRLAGTTRWLVTTTFGDLASVDRESARVRLMHDRVRATVPVAATALTAVPAAVPGSVTGAPPYSANDPHLLRWVHLSFTDSFLVTHQVWGGAIPGGADGYVADSAKAAVPLGLDDPPRSQSELTEQLRGFDGELRGGAEAREVARYIVNPPLPAAARPAYLVLAAAAVSTIDPRHRELLGLPAVPRLPARLATAALLGGMRLALGGTSPSEAAALSRLARLAG